MKRDPEPGIAARYPSTCTRCSGSISNGDRVVYQRGSYIHVGCASGQDES